MGPALNIAATPNTGLYPARGGDDQTCRVSVNGGFIYTKRIDALKIIGSCSFFRN